MTNFGPCADWPVTWPCTVDVGSAPVTGYAVTCATYILWALTGRQFDTCQTTLRPCRRSCYNDDMWPFGWQSATGLIAWIPGVTDDRWWFDVACGRCVGTCSCSTLSEVLLPAPVRSVDVVRVDGAVLVTGGYRLDDDRRLVRLGATWPACNDLNLDDSQVGTWSVTATYGQPPPPLASLAVGELACMLLRAIGGDDCRLPRDVKTLARQGTTITFTDVGKAFKDGMIGLPTCDLFITTTNPGRLRHRSKTYRVDDTPARRVGSS